MQQVVGMTPGLITVALAVFGFAGLVGSALFSRFYDGHGKPFLVLCIAGVAASLLLLGPLAGSTGAVVAACGAMVCACLLLTVTVLFRHLRYTVAQ